MLELIVRQTQSLKEFTENNYAQASFFWAYLLKNKDIRVNGIRVNQDLTLQAGDVVRYYLTPKQEEKPAFHEVYKDDNILVVDKESGVNSEAVYAALARRYGENCRFVHRLDRNTKGLMAFALSEDFEKELLAAFRARRVEKIYHALCFNRPQKNEAVLTAYLKKDGEKATVRVYDTPAIGREQIVTAYKILEQKTETVKLEVTLHTGKTHQIRAHLAHIGCPVVGDMKYGDAQKNKKYSAARQCLVAKYLSFTPDGAFAYLKDKRFVSRFDAEIFQDK